MRFRHIPRIFELLLWQLFAACPFISTFIMRKTLSEQEFDEFIWDDKSPVPELPRVPFSIRLLLPGGVFKDQKIYTVTEKRLNERGTHIEVYVQQLGQFMRWDREDMVQLSVAYPVN